MNPLLSEFEGLPVLRRLTVGRLALGWIVLLVFVWAALATLFAWLAHANCVTQTFRGPKDEIFPVVFGYWAELNHGPYHLIGVPLVMIFSAWFIQQTSDALEALTHGRNANLYLTSGEGNETPSKRIGKHNQRIFRVILPMSFLLSAYTVYTNEYGTYDAKHIGWVQAPKFGDKWSAMDGQSINEIVFELPRHLEHFRSEDPQKASGIWLVHSRRGCAIGPRGDRFAYPFLTLALGHQILSYALGMWIAAKMLFVLIVFFVVFCRIDQEHAQGLRIRLKFHDEEKRFGLGSLDEVYDNALIVVFLAAIGVLLQFQNSFKDTASALQDQGQLARFLSFAIPGIVVGAFVLLPVFAFAVLVSNAKRKEHLRLIGEFDGAQTEAHRDIVEERVRLLRKQRTWPRDDKQFYGLVILIITLIIFIPMGMADVGPKWVGQAIRVVTKELPASLCSCKEDILSTRSEVRSTRPATTP
jgi:hypothetical protein